MFILYSVLLVSLTCANFKLPATNAIYLSPKEQYALDELLQEFSQNPTHYRFDAVVSMGVERAKHFPKVLIWCPMQHFKVIITCPVHKCPLILKGWTSRIDAANYLNPRLVYDLEGNIILIQAIYVCSGYHERYLSASQDIINILPLSVKQAFSVRLSYKSACSLRLLDHLVTSVSLGNNFLEITELIASLNYRAFCRIYGHETDVTTSFHDNVLFSPIGNDKLMQVFLSYYEEIRPFIDHFFRGVTCKILTCDHTFKVSKHIGAVRFSDSTFVKQFQNLFVGLNENGEVVLWRFTKTTKCEEITDLIGDLKERCPTEKPLEMVIVDDCCHVRNFYKSHFPNVPVKLDIFHAVQRVVKTLPKGEPQSQTFGKEISLIFRTDGDIGEERMMTTPEPEEIEANLEILLHRWKGMLTKATLDAFANLRQHINKGCLSGIAAGAGTSRNERLHRHLKRSLLGGVSSISPELAIAVLSVVLYNWTCRRKEPACAKNQRVKAIPPPELLNFSLSDESQLHAVSSKPPSKIPSGWKGSLKNQDHFQKAQDTQSHRPSCTAVRSIKDLQNINVVNYILTRALHILDFYSTLKQQTSSRLVSLIDMIGMEKYFQTLLTKDPNSGTCVEIEGQCNIETLSRNLASFKKVREPTTGDGNCCFGSVVKQLHKLLCREEHSDYLRFMNSLGLGKSEKEDTKQIRHLFCYEIDQNRRKFCDWLGINDAEIDRELEAFNQQGWFNSSVGDLIVRVCCDILQVPIVVITSFPKAPYLSFVPDNVAVAGPLYLAFNHSAPGHYDSTSDENTRVVKQKYCQCGKKHKGQTTDQVRSCITTDNSRCSCLANGEKCDRLCRCYNCCNPFNQNGEQEASPPKPLKTCRCGSNRKDSPDQFSACTDVAGRRKSKCPCLKSGSGCKKACKCVKCKNPHNETTRQSNDSINSSPVKRRRVNPDPYQRKSAVEFMPCQGMDITSGSWTNLETIVLLLLMDTIGSYALPCSSENVRELFNFAATSEDIVQMNLPLGTKRSAQIVGKMNYIQTKRDVKRELLS